MKKMFNTKILIITIFLFSISSILARPNTQSWTHIITPDMFNQDLIIEEDLRMSEDEVIIQVMNDVDSNVTLNSSTRIKGYKYKVGFIYLQPIGANILFDMTLHSLRFKGGSDHHHFHITKNMGDGTVRFTISNDRHLIFIPKKD